MTRRFVRLADIRAPRAVSHLFEMLPATGSVPISLCGSRSNGPHMCNDQRGNVCRKCERMILEIRKVQP